MELLGLDPSQIGLTGLVALVVLLILFGLLVPRKNLTDVQKDRDAWRTAYETSERTRAEQTVQLAELVELAKTTNVMISALPKRRSDDLA